MLHEKQELANITFYRGGIALAGKLPGTHIDNEYDVIRDETDTDGMRTIILQEKDLTPLRQKARKLANVLAEKIGESESKAVKDLLFDVLKDYYEETIDTLYKMVVEGKEVKVKEGCFKIIIGDGRRKNSEEIMLRE